MQDEGFKIRADEHRLFITQLKKKCEPKSRSRTCLPLWPFTLQQHFSQKNIQAGNLHPFLASLYFFFKPQRIFLNWRHAAHTAPTHREIRLEKPEIILLSTSIHRNVWVAVWDDPYELLSSPWHTFAIVQIPSAGDLQPVFQVAVPSSVFHSNVSSNLTWQSLQRFADSATKCTRVALVTLIGPKPTRSLFASGLIPVFTCKWQVFKKKNLALHFWSVPVLATDENLD